MDAYQAIYDATSSKIRNGDVGSAIENAISQMGLGHYVQMAMSSVAESVAEHGRPCAVFKPTLTLDGNKWFALFGENIQEGVCGYGDSPAEAMYEFDKSWNQKVKS